MLEIRKASLDDAPEILEIYTPYVRESTVTFEYEVPSADEFRKRMQNIMKEFPYIVCCIDGKIAGYAYASHAWSRAAYQWNAELSVYLDMSMRKKGIGSLLYKVMLDIVKRQNYRYALALITVPNEDSELFHESFGFKRMCVLKNVGYKHGKWLDVTYMNLELNLYNDVPEDIINFNDLEYDFSDMKLK